MLAYDIKINRLTSPVGMDAGTVLVSWICDGGIKQTAYRVKFENKGNLLFDSGIVSTSNMFCRPGYSVPSRTKVDVTVSLCDENGVWGDDGHTYFETGIAKDEWSAKWIDPELVHPEFTRHVMDPKPLNKASYLKKEFERREPGNARLYITAYGIYNAYINGTEVDGYYMAPGTSDYEHRLQVQTSFFECGIPDVNRLFENVIWSMKSNFVDVPTDCPHREKLGLHLTSPPAWTVPQAGAAR